MPDFRHFFTAPQLPVDLFRCESDPSMTLKTNSGEFWCSRRSKKCLKNNIGIFIYRFLFHRIAIIDCFGKICQSFLSMETFFCCFGKKLKRKQGFSVVVINYKRPGSVDSQQREFTGLILAPANYFLLELSSFVPCCKRFELKKCQEH